MNIINPTGLMNTDNQSAPLFAMLGRFSGGQKNVENVGRKSVAFYNKLFFPLAQPQSKSYQVSKWFSGSQFTVTTEQICPNVDQKDETWATAGKTEWLTGLVYWHIHHSQTQQPLSHAVIFSAGLDTVQPEENILLQQQTWQIPTVQQQTLDIKHFINTTTSTYQITLEGFERVVTSLSPL